MPDGGTAPASRGGQVGAAALALAFAAAAAGAVALARPEAAALALAAGSAGAPAAVLLAQAPAMPLSHNGAGLVLDTCAAALAGPASRITGSAVRARLAPRCAGLAAAALRRAPGWAAAHHVSALAAAEAGDPAAALAALERARAAAPYESWLGRRRADLAFRLGGAAAGYDLDAEIAALAQSEAGRRYLARASRAMPGAAARIEALRPSLPDAVELRLLRALLHDGGPGP